MRSRRIGWLGLGAVSLGCGIWTTHFIAMIGFSVNGSVVEYDTRLTLLSLAVAIAVVAAGVFLGGCRSARPAVLGAAGLLTGLGVAAMHCIGMAGVSVRLDRAGTSPQSSVGLTAFLLAMVAGPVAVLVLAAVIVMFDPEPVLGNDERPRAARPAARGPTPGGLAPVDVAPAGVLPGGFAPGDVTAGGFAPQRYPSPPPHRYEGP